MSAKDKSYFQSGLDVLHKIYIMVHIEFVGMKLKSEISFCIEIILE
jgi:hypothetical protein